MSDETAEAAPCNACGIVGRPLVHVFLTNGGLVLCRQCLDELNRKSPLLAAVAGERDAALKQVHDLTCRACHCKTPRIFTYPDGYQTCSDCLSPIVGCTLVPAAPAGDATPDAP